eukprot:m.91027 g.91027  ORF g.91027 m.91027 type:complete len:76 (+) comp36674_c0_seq1:3118-3345(+)
MGKKSRRPRQKIAKPSSYRPDSEVLKLIDQILKGEASLGYTATLLSPHLPRNFRSLFGSVQTGIEDTERAVERLR